MTVKERLEKYISAKNISVRSFSLSIGMSGNYVSSMRKSIHPRVLTKISELYPDLNTNWLLTGEGEMLKGFYDVQSFMDDFWAKLRQFLKMKMENKSSEDLQSLYTDEVSLYLLMEKVEKLERHIERLEAEIKEFKKNH